MKLSIVLILLAFGSAAYAQTTILSGVAWLEGSWTRTNAKPGRSGFEKWKKTSDTEMLGTGINMKGSDTTLVEKLSLVVREGQLYYVADVPENKGVVYFKCIEMSASHFVCENPDHDFPKRIVYRKEGNSMKATISGDGKSIDYLFERKP